MKNSDASKNVNQQSTASSYKNPPTTFVFVLCAVTIVIIAVTTMMLGVSLSKFSQKENNTISLAVSENIDAEKGNDGNTTNQNNGGGSADAHSESNPSENSQPQGYHGELNVNDDVLKWSTETSIDLFKESYDGTVQSDDGGKRIAPGTANYYDFTVKNDGNIPLDYAISLKIETFFEGQNYSEIPIEWRLLTADKDVISDWQILSDRSEVLKEGTLDLRHQDSYTIEWHWKFERGQDAADTELGNLSFNQPMGVNATIYVYAEQSADWDGRVSVLPRTEDIFNPVFYLVLLVISVCALLILIVVYKRRKKDENIQNDQG